MMQVIFLANLPLHSSQKQAIENLTGAEQNGGMISSTTIDDIDVIPAPFPTAKAPRSPHRLRAPLRTGHPGEGAAGLHGLRQDERPSLAPHGGPNHR